MGLVGSGSMVSPSGATQRMMTVTLVICSQRSRRIIYKQIYTLTHTHIA